MFKANFILLISDIEKNKRVCYIYIKLYAKESVGKCVIQSADHNN